MALFKRKDKDTKKGAESAIGKIIYGFLLFMPLISIGARCLYVVFNKNAYQSYSDTQVERIQNVPLTNGTTAGITYQVSYRSSIGSTNSKIAYDYISIDWTDYGASNQYVYTRFYFQQSADYVQIYLYQDEGAPIQTLSNVWGNTLTSFSFTSSANQTINANAPMYLNIVTYQTISLDNVFEYSINQVENSNLYNWASETGTYTVLNTTCNQLGITNTFIPLLFAYWLLTSVIYFIFDIALILIWMIHNKIHELQESI